MTQYRKKPVVIDAWQFNPQTLSHPDWLSNALKSGAAYFQGGDFERGDQPFFSLQTLEGVMRAVPGDWIIRGIRGELYPCKPDIFAATYEAV